MGTILKACLLLGLAAALIPAAYARKCCGSVDCKVKIDCPKLGNSSDFVCVKKKSKNVTLRACQLRENSNNEECYAVKGDANGEICYCDDKDFCNKSGPLKGPSFGALGIVLLGGVGFLRGQLFWG